ncbi:MAG: FG-GAP repeat domain-containing protein [Candidatus Kryptoniota bacterium]
MIDIAGVRHVQLFKQAVIQLVFVVNIARISEAQVYTPILKTVDMQATIAPLGQMVAGNFTGSHQSIAAISKSEKALYLFEPDSMENLILTNVISLPDTPIAIAKGREVLLDSLDHEKIAPKIAVLMKSHFVAMVSFGEDGRPVVSREASIDAYCTGVAASDLETSGKIDIVAFGRFALGISEAKNAGRGEFQEARILQGPLGSIPFSDVAFTDFNGDLVPDIAALDWVNHKLLIFYGRGDGSFTQPVSFRLKGEPSTLSVADLDNNGYPDIVVGYSRLSRIDIYGGDGFGRFYLRQTLNSLGPISQFVTADLTGNGTTDIAAFSEDTKEITLFCYDSSAKDFDYAGEVGIGANYENIIALNFPNQVHADLVASSPTENFIKVFKTASLFSRNPDITVPVCADPVSVSVCGNDSSSYLIIGNSQGRIAAVHYVGHAPSDSSVASDWQSQGTSSLSILICGMPPDLLLSYSDADILSFYELFESGKNIVEHMVRTAFLPFIVNGAVENDSAIIGAAYRIHPDSSVGISFFSSMKGEFIEHDYGVNEKIDYVNSALAIHPYPAFFRLWKSGDDTLTFAYTNLDGGKTTSISMEGSQSELVSSTSTPLLLLEDHDTLSIFESMFVKPKLLELHQIYVNTFDDSDFKSIRVASSESTLYLVFYSHRKREIFLSAADVNTGFASLIKSWHVESEPDDMAISPATDRIFFLNRAESYVTISDF